MMQNFLIFASGTTGMGRIADRLLSRGRVAIADIGQLPPFSKGSRYENEGLHAEPPAAPLCIGRPSRYAGRMLLIVGTVRLPASNLDAARPVMKRMADASRSEEGCIEYGYAEDVFVPGLIHVKEIWIDQRSLDRHFASSHIAEWRAAWPDLGIGDRDLHVFDVDDPRST